MRPGFDATRRNRNIGTAKQGNGRDNRLVIPAVAGTDRQWAEELGPHQQYQRTVAGRSVIFVVEETNGGCEHACTIEDVAHVLANIPMIDWEGIETFVLRQSTRKQRLLRPAWGRMFYSADLGLPGRRTLRLGPAVILEAQDLATRLVWPTSLVPEDAAELQRLMEDGHEVSRQGRRHVLTMTRASVRATQLYRTLLHEIGHWVDYSQKVLRPEEAGGDYEFLSAAYFARPADEREAFAHRYADAAGERLRRFGITPFESMPLMRKGGPATPAHADEVGPEPEEGDLV